MFPNSWTNWTIKSRKQNNVYTEVPYTGQELISLKWVCSFKNIDDNVVAKSQLAGQKKKKKRPYIAFDVCQLGTNFKYSEDKDFKYAYKIIAYLTQEPVQIMYQNLGNECNLKLSIFADVSHGNLSDGGSQSGYLIMLVGDDGKCSLLNWQSKRIKHVLRGTLAAETLALNDAVDDGIYISEIVSELLFNEAKSLPIEIYTNSKSWYNAIKSKENILEKD